jgi:LPS-assembly protein
MLNASQYQYLIRFLLMGLYGLGLILSASLIITQQANAQDQGEPIDFAADSIQTNQETGLFVATGNVVFSQGIMSLKADKVEYNRQTGQAMARGNVIFTDHDGNIHFSDQMEMDDQFTRAFAEPLISRMADKSWMTGQTGEYVKDDYTVYDNATYTPCDCDYANGETPIWQIDSSTSWHDPNTKTVYHSNIQMKILRMPVMYFPFLSHPDWTVRRRSGLLYPSISYSSDHGIKYIQSYYHVIDDTSDVEIRPYIFKNTGTLTKVRYRKLWDQSDIDIDMTGGSLDTFNESNQRVLAGTINANTVIGDKWITKASIDRTSQDTFMRRYDIDAATRLKSEFLAENIGHNTYSRVESYDIQGLGSTETSEKEPTVLPSVFHERYIVSPRKNMATRLRLNASQVDNDEDYDINRWSGELYTFEEFPTSVGQFSFESRAAMQYHMIEHSPTSTAYTGELGQASGTIGLGWSQPFTTTVGNSRAIIQPKFKMISIKATERIDNIPNRDSADFHLDESNLFLLHRYQGQDYIKTGTHMAGGVSANMMKTPIGNMTGFLGASYRMAGDVQSGLNATNDEKRLSDILASIRMQPIDNLNLSFTGRFNPDDFYLNESRSTLSWSRPGTSFNTTYTQRSESYFSAASIVEEELIVGLDQVIHDGVTLTAKQTYDLSNGQSFQDKSVIGIDITRGLQDCLTITMQYTRDETSDRDIQPVDEIMFLLNFKYLGAFQNSSAGN